MRTVIIKPSLETSFTPTYVTKSSAVVSLNLDIKKDAKPNVIPFNPDIESTDFISKGSLKFVTANVNIYFMPIANTITLHSCSVLAENG